MVARGVQLPGDKYLDVAAGHVGDLALSEARPYVPLRFPTVSVRRPLRQPSDRDAAGAKVVKKAVEGVVDRWGFTLLPAAVEWIAFPDRIAVS